MFEIELKFQVPPSRRAELMREVSAPASAHTSHLKARYFDTTDRCLAEAGLALRLRQEDGVWVQTLKGRGDAQVRRLEHEIGLGTGAISPRIDPSRHAGTPAGRALMAALGAKSPKLKAVFETDVMRSHRLVRSGGASVELAFDLGDIRAGDRSLALCELELELKSGPLTGLVALARRMVKRHGLCLDVRSKAERGELLARGATCSPARKSSPAVLSAQMSGDAALRAMVLACLEQILPNFSALADGAGGIEHVHQARVGLRRLRAALRLFGSWSASAEQAWGPALDQLFERLGRQRDRDMLAASLLPELLSAGAPFAELPAASDGGLAEALRSPACSLGLLQLLGFALGSATETAPARKRKAVAIDATFVIERLHRRVSKNAAGFMDMDDEARHRLRKRLKRLRYGLELASSLLRAKPVRRLVAALQPAQDALGRYNDLGVAEAMFRAQLPQHPRALFAIGWLAARRGDQEALAAAALRKKAFSKGGLRLA